MLKKKNIAMAMAAATAVTAFAPMAEVSATGRAIIDNGQTEEVVAVKEKVAKLINLKYTTKSDLLNTVDPGSKVIDVKIEGMNLDSSNVEQPYASYAAFEKDFDRAYSELEDGQTLKVMYGYAQGVGYTELEDGTVVDHKVEKFVSSDFASATDKAVDNSAIKAGELVKTTALDGTVKYQVKLSNTEEKFMEVKVGDNKLDFTRPILKTKDGYYVDAKGNSIQAVTDADVITLSSGTLSIPNGVIVGFNLDKTNAAPTKQMISDVVTKEEGHQKIQITASEMYNVSEGRLTEQGNRLVREIDGLWHESDEDFTYRIEKTETVKDEELKLIAYKMNNRTNKEVKLVELTVSADDADTRGKAYEALKEMMNRNYEGKTAIAAGEDRYETAIEISRLGWARNTANQVVLVSGANNALVDGLTATPLAKQLNGDAGAPVLLTKKDEVPAEVLAELKRLGTNEIFIVGGENSVSAEVEETLRTRYGMKVTRLAGEGRYETSMAVAKEMKNHVADITNAFVVGGNGLADALSAAAEAAKLEAPILLTPQSKLDKDVELFLTTELVATNDVFVVGGTGSVSEATFNKIVDINGEILDVERLAGDNRQDTNAAVIDRFANADGTADNIVVAKSNNAGLVDALGAGALAAKLDGVVVLATNELTLKQEDALNGMDIVDNSASTGGANAGVINKVQAGNGIASAVAKFIKGLK